MSTRIESLLQRLADLFFSLWPRSRPEPPALARGHIISHRGEHDNRTILENTLPAFARAETAGVWGIELDVRWTRDRVPVVLHDPDLARLHNLDLKIRAVDRKRLKALCPAVPSLADVVQRFGGRLHLMIEIKEFSNGDGRQRQRLIQVLSPLTPVRDYHLMALDTRLLERLNFFPPRALVAIANYWPGRISRLVASKPWGGLCAHYLLMPSYLIRRHHGLGQCIGIGYAASRNSLLRELHRGVDWIFSNQAARMQALMDGQ